MRFLPQFDQNFISFSRNRCILLAAILKIPVSLAAALFRNFNEERLAINIPKLSNKTISFSQKYKKAYNSLGKNQHKIMADYDSIRKNTNILQGKDDM